MKNKKIAIIYSGGRSKGGIERYFELLFENFQEKDMELVLFSFGEWPLTTAIRESGRKVEVFSRSRISFGNIFSMWKKLIKNQYSLIVTHGNVSNFYGRMISLLTGIPVLATVHSDLKYDYPNIITNFIYKAIDQLTRFQTKKYITVSEHLKKRLISSGVPINKIVTIYNGVPEINIPPKKGDTIVVGSIGRLHRVKNYGELISAAGICKNVNIFFKIWGDGAEKNRLQANIDNMKGCGDFQVSLEGETTDVAKTLSEIDIYIQPSLSEGFGLTVVDAMLAGKPVIVSPGGALPELANGGKAGLVMDGYDRNAIISAVDRLLEDKVLAKELAINGQKFARENFAIDKWIKGTARIYKETING